MKSQVYDDPTRLPDSILDGQRQAWLDGLRPTIEGLLIGTPFQDNHEAQLDLIYNEIVVREELGFTVDRQEYVRRYPHLKQDLELHFEIHQAIQGPLLMDTLNPRHEKTWPEMQMPASGTNSPTDDYELIRLLGQGGMAVVYQARHRRLHRDVALKMFQPGRVLTSREVSRIRTEAEAIARLSHPNIIQIFEIGQYQGSAYLALELAEQGTLSQKLQQFPFTAVGAAELVETLARALHHAHQRHVIHRDLKPANILFASDGTPKITDFGLAKVLHDSKVIGLDATCTGEAMGTPRYMAPEQAAGQHDRVGPATDVYALGTLLFECLTGRAPFVAASVIDTLFKIRTEDPISPSRLQPSTPRDLETICLHCLEKDPGHRYATAEELADDLRRFRNCEPIRIRPTSCWEKMWKWRRRRPAHAALIAVFCLAFIGSIALAAFKVHSESMRIRQLRRDISVLMKQGQLALEEDDLGTAQARFQSAWMKVHSEPSLSDHETSVAGWLDHARLAANRYRWKQRTPPRDFDDRRDEALLASLLILPHMQRPIECAREILQEALDLTLPSDAAWQVEREQLILADAKLLAIKSGTGHALARLNDLDKAAAREVLEYRSHLLDRLGQTAEAESVKRQMSQLPARRSNSVFVAGMDQLRSRRFQAALAEFESLLNEDPAHFTGRLFQAICFLRLGRPAEAKVAFTACIAQRPGFIWNYYFRSQALLALGDRSAAIRDLQEALEVRPKEPHRLPVLIDLGILYGMESRDVEAFQILSQATEGWPAEAAGWTCLAWLKLLQGKLDESRHDFTAALEIRPTSLEALLGISIARLQEEAVHRTLQKFTSNLPVVSVAFHLLP